MTVECACLVARACPPLPLVEKAVSAWRMALACEERLVPPSVPQNRPRCAPTRAPGNVQGELCSGAFCSAFQTPQRVPPVSGRSRWSAHTGFAAACVQKNGGKRATNGQGPDAHGRKSGLFGATLHPWGGGSRPPCPPSAVTPEGSGFKGRAGPSCKATKVESCGGLKTFTAPPRLGQQTGKGPTNLDVTVGFLERRLIHGEEEALDRLVLLLR